MFININKFWCYFIIILMLKKNKKYYDFPQTVYKRIENIFLV